MQAPLHKKLALLDTAHEVRGFQDEPQQMRAAAPGKVGVLRLGFSLKNKRHILHDLYRAAPLLVQQALYWDEAMPELPICSMISVGGGVLQGDRYKIDISVEDDACAHVTSQGANRIHQMDANYASQYQTITVKSGGYLEYLPEMTILYRGSRYITQTDLVVAKGATLIYSEPIMAGRKHHRADERFGFDLLSMTTNLCRPDGKRLFSEKILIDRANPTIDFAAVMKGFDVFANVLCVTPPESASLIQSQITTNFESGANAISSLSRLPNDAGLMFRIVASESYYAREEIRRFWKSVREVVKGKELHPAIV